MRAQTPVCVEHRAHWVAPGHNAAASMLSSDLCDDGPLSFA
jgi:hypothetical protein